ncbi:hypothetical protein FPV67DRAFT_1652919 [Lyophyllum atratum]|nr:hypothetical protein FPV67DRAFT_1652919 [Lyophyllum atratum]
MKMPTWVVPCRLRLVLHAGNEKDTNRAIAFAQGYHSHPSRRVATDVDLFASANHLRTSSCRGDVTGAVTRAVALALEHLEHVFYIAGLDEFNETPSTDPGFSPCPHTDVKPFIARSQALGGVGITAYSGAARFITNKDHLTAPATVLAREACHASCRIPPVVSMFSGRSGDFGHQRSFSMAGAFITSCTSTNPVHPLKAKALPGSAITFKFDSSAVTSDTKLLQRSLEDRPPHQDGKVIVPKDLIGTLYVSVGNRETKAADSDIVAGQIALNSIE